MKHNYFKHLFTALLLLCTTVVTAHDFEVGGIYYNILSGVDKTVAVTFKGTEYGEYSNEYTGNVVIPTSVTKSEIVTNILETFDDWRSSNKSNSTTSQTSYTLNVEAGNILKFDWLVSSESNYDWLIITLDGTEIVKKSGTLSGSYEKTFDVAGTHTLLVKYTKDSSSYGGNDEGEICNITLNSIVCVEELEYSVTSIGNYAFRDCTSLTSITIPNSITSIGDWAFYNCKGLTSVEFNAENCTEMGSYPYPVFSGCTALSTVTFGENVKNIPAYAFYECTGLKEVHISDLSAWCNISFGSSNANPLFYAKKLYLNDELITELTIPNSIRNIRNYAFYNCSGLTSITIPNSVTSIGERAFYYCTGLTNITIPNSVTSIENEAFRSCYGLTSITIHNSVTSIGKWAFSGCDGLTSITIPNSVTSIENYAFSGCTGLTNITVETGNTKYDSRDNCNAIIETETNTLISGCKNTVIPNSVTSIGNNAFYRCTGLTSITIPNSVTSIGNSAFYGCWGLTSITIPNSVTSIGDYAFQYCIGLTSITIPNSVTSIGGSAFSNCEGLTSITIPNSVTSIGNSAFSWCDGLTSIKIPNSVTSIGNYAFSGCDGLTSIKIPNSVTSIGNNAFYRCTGLKSITIPDSVTSIGDYAFESCTGLTSITIPNSVTSIGESAFRDCTGLTSVTIPNSVTSIGNDAFSGCTGLTSVIIPNSVTSIGERVFAYCIGLTSVEIPNSVTSIGYQAFSGCTGLTSIEIPNSVTSIGNDAFSGTAWYNNQPDGVVYAGKVLYEYKGTMPSNTSITIKDGTLGITDFAFRDCYGLASVVIGNGVTSIGDYAFQYCTGLTSIEIPNSVTSIGKRAFEGCYRLASVIIGNGVTSIGSYAFGYCDGLTSITSLIPAEDLFAIDSDVFSGVDKNACTLYVPYGAKETYATTEGWEDFVNIEGPKVTITINQYGSATYCSPFALDFSEVEGLKAYSAIGFNSSTQVVTLARVMTTPAEAGIFVKGEPGEYVVPTIEECNEHTLNLLVGTLEQTTVNSTEDEMSNYKFTVAELDEAPMFYPFEDNTTFSAGKAYLQIPTAWLPATAQKSVSIRFDEGETTGIDELKGENGEGKTIYDLQGRVVENPTSGIYIIDGKKTLVK